MAMSRRLQRVKRVTLVTPPSPLVTSNTTVTTATPVITGTADADSIITLAVNGVTYTSTTNPNGEWSISVTNALDSGTYSFSVTATDKAGNVSTATTQTLIVALAPGGMLWQDAPASTIGTTVTGRNSDGTYPSTGIALQNWELTPWNIYGDNAQTYVKVIADIEKTKAIQFTGAANIYGTPLSAYGGYNHQRAEQVPSFTAHAGDTLWLGFDLWVNTGLGTAQSGSWQGCFQFMSDASKSGPNLYMSINVATTGYPLSIVIGAAQGPVGTPHFVQDMGETPQSTWTRMVIGMYVTDSETTSWVEAWRDGICKLPKKMWRSFDETGNAAGGLFYPDSTMAYMKFGIYRGVNDWPIEYRMANMKLATTRNMVM